MTEYLHELVAAVKKLAVELERTPTRAELESAISGGHYKLSKVGGYIVVCQAAGVPTYDDRRKKLRLRMKFLRLILKSI